MKKKPSESKLEGSFAKAFRANPAPMVVSDKDSGQFFDMNDRWIQLIGYTREEMLAHTSKELGIWEDWESRARIVHLFEQSGEARDIPTRIRTKAGATKDVLWSLECIELDGRESMLSLLYDVTDLRLSQDALRASEERFKHLVRHSSDIITLLDANGMNLSINGPVEKVLGYTAEELIGTNAFNYIDPFEQDQVHDVLADLLREPGGVRRVEYRFRHKNGSWIAMETVGTNLLHDPVVKGLVLNSRDITERNRLQEQLQQAMKMEAVGRLAGGIAHDFNNLLTAILGNVELTRLDVADSDPIAGSLDEIQRAAVSAASLTRQLLSFSRRQIIEPKVLNLGDLVTNLRNLLSRLLGEDITLTLRLAEHLGSTRVDPGQFEQVLVNLAVNARDAMPNGGRLAIATENVSLDDRFCQRNPELRPGDFVQVAISDTGMGMSPEVKRRLFEPFFTTKPTGRGTGLGLATTFGTVKQAGGHIEVYSEPGIGTTFKIYLPRVEKVPEDKALDTLPAARSQGGETILLVEDDAGVRELTLVFLRRLGYQAVAAANPAEALMLIEKRSRRFDLLMTDVVMPGMNGRELAERLIALHPTTKVLFTSGYTEDVIVHHGVMDANMNFISKPYTLQTLAGKLREILDGKGK